MSRTMKDSGLDWIGDVPFGWEFARMKDAGKFQTGRDHKHLKKGTVPVFGSSNQPFAFVDTPLCKVDALAIGRKGTIDVPFVAKAPFWAVDTCMYHTVQNRRFSKTFMSYWMQVIPWALLSTQTALPSLTQTEANNVIVACPPLDEQRRIAAYLDRQTSLIDRRVALIGKKRRLLAEARKAIIHEAVTKGLDKGAAMKDSGVEWIGEIPAGWGVGRLKDASQVNAGNPAPKPELFTDDGNIPFLRVSDLSKAKDGICHSARDWISDPKKLSLKVWKKGTIVLPKSGESIRTNVRARLGREMAVVSHLACLVPNKKVNHEYLFLLLSDIDFEQKIAQTALPALGLNLIGDFEIPSPPLSEQRCIADYLNKTTANLAKQMELLGKMEALLKEQRKAIIHEAVTGKIDLSAYEPPNDGVEIAQDDQQASLDGLGEGEYSDAEMLDTSEEESSSD